MALSVQVAVLIAKNVKMQMSVLHVFTIVTQLLKDNVNVLQGNSRQAIITAKTAYKVAKHVSLIAVLTLPLLVASQLNVLHALTISNSTMTVSV